LERLAPVAPFLGDVALGARPIPIYRNRECADSARAGRAALSVCAKVVYLVVYQLINGVKAVTAGALIP
jgi:hypothetical protein